MIRLVTSFDIPEGEKIHKEGWVADGRSGIRYAFGEYNGQYLIGKAEKAFAIADTEDEARAFIVADDDKEASTKRALRPIASRGGYRYGYSSC